MALMGYREYARHAGVTLRAIQKAIEAGHIAVNADKKIDADIADRDWKQGKQALGGGMSMAAPAKNRATLAAPPCDPEDEEPDGPVADATTSEYRTSRAMRERYQAQKQKLEYEQLAGELISVADAKRIAYTSFRSIRDALLNIPARLKDELAAQTDAHLCEKLLEAALSAALLGIDVGKLLQDTDE